MAAPHPQRRWFQFNLRTLFVVLTLISVFLGWLAVERNTMQRREAAIAAIIDLPGGVMCDDTQHLRPYWLQSLIGIKSKGEIVEVCFYGTNVTDAELVHVAGMKELERLDLQGRQVTNMGLVQLAGMTKLEWLDLSETHVTDAGLTHLTHLKKLKWLNLSGTQVTSHGVNELKNALPGLVIVKNTTTPEGGKGQGMTLRR